ncbi:MAG: hypothetical protein R6X12_01845 [bacterium]
MCGTEAGPGTWTASLYYLVVFAGLIAAGVVLVVRRMSRGEERDK